MVNLSPGHSGRGFFDLNSLDNRVSCSRPLGGLRGTIIFDVAFLQVKAVVQGVIAMKTLLSSLALSLALGFAMPAFAGDVTAAKNAADCEKAGGAWDAAKNVCSEKKM